jgi:hypothetical protein
MHQKAHGEFHSQNSTTQSPKSISSREQFINETVGKIEQEFEDKYRKHYERTKQGDKEIMEDWKKDIRKKAPAINVEEVLRLEDELWNS